MRRFHAGGGGRGNIMVRTYMGLETLFFENYDVEKISTRGLGVKWNIAEMVLCVSKGVLLQIQLWHKERCNLGMFFYLGGFGYLIEVVFYSKTRWRAVWYCENDEI